MARVFPMICLICAAFICGTFNYCQSVTCFNINRFDASLLHVALPSICDRRAQMAVVERKLSKLSINKNSVDCTFF